MTTIAELVDTAPDPTFGVVLTNLPEDPEGGQWRWVVEGADPLAGVDVEFFDFTAFYLSDHVERGADEYMGDYRGAVVQLQLQLDDKHAAQLGVPVDMLAGWGQDTSALFGVNLPLGSGLIMRAGVILVREGVVAGGGAIGVGWFPAWTGVVDKWGGAANALGQLRTHPIRIHDTLASLIGVPVPSFGGTDPWQDRITAILGFADWRYGADIYGSFDVIDMPVRDDAADALQELDTVGDPIGIVFRTRRNGRLIFHPAPWDLYHASFEDESDWDGAIWQNPLLDLYADGLVFSYQPDVNDLAYVADDRFPAFDIEDTSEGVVNDLAFDMAGSPYPIDDPTSKDRHGVQHRSVTWIVENQQAADDLLLRFANATKQALPMMTTVDLQNFWPAMGLVDHLDPVTVVHADHETGLVVTGTGTIRRIVEDRVLLHETALQWVTVLQHDIESTEVAQQLLPVENLDIDSLSSHEAEFTWTNPTQLIEPTDTQLRIVGYSNIWIDWPYPMTFYQTPFLNPTTAYRFEVRLVRKVNGIVTNFSPVRAFDFITGAITVPVIIPDPGGDPGDTNVEIPVDEDCLIEWVIEENDGTGWTEFMSGDQDDLVFNPVSGQWNLPSPIDNDDFNPANLYRVGYREDCGEGFGDWIYGAEEDPPDDWTDPCPDPPVVGDPPFDAAELLVFVPILCPTEEP